jgi:flagellar hook-length control protein FliK
MATEMPPARPVANVAPLTPWDRQREDPRQAVLARLLSPDGRPLPVAATDAAPTAGGLVRARLMEARGNNEALVDIGGKPFLIRTRLPLPVGASVLLRVIDPGVDDAELARVDGRASAVDAKGKSAPAGRVGLDTLIDDATATDEADAVGPQRPATAPALETLRSDTGDARVRVSGTARLMSELAPSGQPKMIQVPPLGQAEQADPARAAQHLQNAVEKSGLFYESHVQAWSEGRRGLDSLRAEPQGGLSQHAAVALSAEAQSALPEPRALNAALASIPPSVRPLVQEQIALLETGQLGLQGTWQGQPFSLQIEPDEQDTNHRALPGERLANWRVRIEMEAPNLGRMQIDIGLAGEAATVRVRAENAQAARTTLGSQTADLLQALDARGVRMQELAIDKTPLAPAAGAAQEEA